MGFQLATEDLMAEAVSSAGLTNFGSGTYIFGLAAPVNSLNSDIELTEGAAGYLQDLISQILRNRLERFSTLQRSGPSIDLVRP